MIVADSLGEFCPPHFVGCGDTAHVEGRWGRENCILTTWQLAGRRDWRPNHLLKAIPSMVCLVFFGLHLLKVPLAPNIAKLKRTL